MVAQYAWDGNAFPGNEYWLGMLTASGDPAAACCSNVPELQGGDSIDFFVPKIFPRIFPSHYYDEKVASNKFIHMRFGEISY